MRVRLVRVQRGEHAPPPEHQQRLEHPDEAGSGLGVTDIALGRAERQRARAALADGLRDGGRLDRVAHRRAGAVRLEGGEVVGRDAGAREHLGDQARLGGAVGQGEAVGPAGRVDAGGQDHAAHRAALGHRARKRLEREHDAALGPDIPVRTRAEGLAAAARREHPGAEEAAEGEGREEEVHAADQRRLRLAARERRAGGVEGDQPGGAGRVQHHRRAAQVKGVGEPVGEDRKRAPCHHVAVAARGVVLAQIRPVRGGGADPHARPRAGGALLRPAGIAQRLARELEKEPLLRVHLRRLAGGDAEAGGIESQGVGVEHARAEMHAAARGPRLRMEEARMGPAAGGHLGDGVLAGGEQVGEGVGAGGAGKAAGHANDRDGRRRRPGGVAPSHHRVHATPGSAAATSRTAATRCKSFDDTAKCLSQVGAAHAFARGSCAARRALASAA